MTPEEIIDLALGILPDRDLHEFSLWCAEQVRHLMSDERSRRALDVKRRWLDGQATDEELEKARAAARAAARDANVAQTAAWAAAEAAAEAAQTAAWAAAWVAAEAAARGAAWAAAEAAAEAAEAAAEAAEAAAEAAARKSQADWLLKNYGSQILHHRMKE